MKTEGSMNQNNQHDTGESFPRRNKENFSDDVTKVWDEPPIFKESDPEGFGDRFDRRKLVSGIKKYYQLLIVFSLVFCVIGAYYSYQVMTTYTASSSVLFLNEKQGSIRLPTGQIIPKKSMGTVIEMITSENNYDGTKSILGLDLSTAQIGAMISVSPPTRGSDIIKISATGRNSNLVVDVVNTLTKIAVKKSQNLYFDQLTHVLRAYRNQLNLLKQRLQSQIQDMEDYKINHRYLGMGADHTGLVVQIEQARKQHEEANFQYNRLLAEYVNLKKETVALPELVSLTQDSENGSLQSVITKLQTSLSEARAKYTLENPKVKSLELQLKDLLSDAQRSSEEGSENYYLGTNKVKQDFNVELIRMRSKLRSAQKIKIDSERNVQELNNELEKLPSLQIAFMKLLNAKEITESQLKEITDAVESTETLLNIPKGDIELYSLSLEAGPWKDRWWVKALPVILLFFGLFLASSIAVGLQVLKGKLCTPKEVEMAYYVPCLIQIPKIPEFNPENASKKTLYFIRRLTDRIHKLHQELFGILQKKHGALSINTISATAGEGKSTLAYHLAEYYQILGKKTLYLDLDAKENPYAKKGEQLSIDSFLRGEGDIKGLIKKNGFDIIQLNRENPLMKELVLSEKMSGFWQEMNRNYDVIVIDSPGVIHDDYAVNLASFTDLNLFVVGSSKVKKHVVDEALATMDAGGVRPSAIILNLVDSVYIENQGTKDELKRLAKT